ncbi:hypothetical protein ACD954_25970, partial [Escherichia coli]
IFPGNLPDRFPHPLWFTQYTLRQRGLRRLSTWETHRDALALVNNVYHRIAGISKDDGLITLQDAEGNTRLISPREAVA